VPEQRKSASLPQIKFRLVATFLLHHGDRGVGWSYERNGTKEMITLSEIKKVARTSRVTIEGYFWLRRGTAPEDNLAEYEYALVRDSVLGSPPSLWEKIGFAEVRELNHSSRARELFRRIVTEEKTFDELQSNEL
jgi:hypothetical protein